MIRNLKALGLALVAVFALSALSASAASAATDHFTSDEEKAILTGVGHNHKFHYPGGASFECTTAKFAATITNGDTEATVDATYNGTVSFNGDPNTQTKTTATHCNSSFGTVMIDMNGCEYNLTGETTGQDPKPGPNVDATVWIKCPGTNKIVITGAFGTSISVPAQTPTEGGVTYQEIANHSGGTKTGVRVTATATGVTATCAPALPCAFAGVPTHSNTPTYNGTVDITGYKDLNSPGVITPAEPNVGEGAKINIGVQTTA